MPRLGRYQLSVMLLLLMSLTACEQPKSGQQTDVATSERNDASANRAVVPAPKLTNDATRYAQLAYQLMNELEARMQPSQAAQLETTVRRPIRQLSTEWRIQVKMTDSVTEGQYAMCRKALTSLDIWAREVGTQDNASSQAKTNYLRDKQRCANALAHPSLGNTDPKMGARS